MKTVVIDGVEYLLTSATICPHDKEITYIGYKPLPPKPKTIVQVAAEATDMSEEDYRTVLCVDAAIYDAIEQRLQAIEKKLEDK
ncbi:MAG: hypothetical protein E6R03_04115 [Hyphomicrobiaceae bacterium]|nr:MAG: hypothetical protein E6R03_04115 [Hyphomicrobiaceae bacterium]